MLNSFVSVPLLYAYWTILLKRIVTYGWQCIRNICLVSEIDVILYQVQLSNQTGKRVISGLTGNVHRLISPSKNCACCTVQLQIKMTYTTAQCHDRHYKLGELSQSLTVREYPRWTCKCHVIQASLKKPQTTWSVLKVQYTRWDSAGNLADRRTSLWCTRFIGWQTAGRRQSRHLRHVLVGAQSCLHNQLQHEAARLQCFTTEALRIQMNFFFHSCESH